MISKEKNENNHGEQEESIDHFCENVERKAVGINDQQEKVRCPKHTLIIIHIILFFFKVA